MISELHDDVVKSIEKIIEERKIKYIQENAEFTEGLLVGLEIAGLYGDKIHEIYTKYNSTDTTD